MGCQFAWKEPKAIIFDILEDPSLCLSDRKLTRIKQTPPLHKDSIVS